MHERHREVTVCTRILLLQIPPLYAVHTSYLSQRQHQVQAQHQDLSAQHEHELHVKVFSQLGGKAVLQQQELMEWGKKL